MFDWQVATQDNKRARYRPIELRRCLGCDHWMRSTSSAHRICNECRIEDEHGPVYTPAWMAGERVA